MTATLADPCTPDQLKAIYGIYLGRNADPSSYGYVGHALAQVIGALIASSEFAALVEKWRADDFAIGTALSGTVIGDAWHLLRSLDAPDGTDRSHAGLLLSGLRLARAGGLTAPVEERIGEVIGALERRQEGAPRDEPALDRLTAVDIDWILTFNGLTRSFDGVPFAHMNRRIARSAIDGDVELCPYVRIGGADQASLRAALFADVAQEADVTIAMLLSRIRAAIWDEQIGHWLFDDYYYTARRDRAFADGRVDRWRPFSSAYADFLLNGDRHGIRPHPLFCPVAYRALNDLPETDGSPFAHFLKYGLSHGHGSSALFDAAFYEAMNPTVTTDIATGRFGSALESFWREGCAAGRPFLPDFDPHYYLAANPDIASDPTIAGPENCAEHFIRVGAAENRASNPYFQADYYLRRYPDIQSICARLDISAIEHFLLFGRQERRTPCPPLIDRAVDIFQAKTLYERRALHAFLRQERAPLDFSDVSRGEPLLSVIVPVHDQVHFTARFLEVAFPACVELQRRTGRAAEIIIVSNGSTDGTADLLARTRGIRSLVIPDAIGYPAAVNEGAAIATGRLMLVVNNDVEFDPHVFADLVASFDDTPQCGAIGPHILSMDLTIQELGSFIGGEGETFGLGRGERAADHARAKKAPVDYVSGCFLCLDREEFLALGGFDTGFSPGYYEEVDLCQRLKAERGKSTFVDPSISIAHYEHASFMKGRPITVSHPVILRNRARLLEKHPDIRLRPAARDLRAVVERRKLGFGQPRLLIVADRIPDPRLGAGAARTAEMLRLLRSLGVLYDIIALNPCSKADHNEHGDIPLYRHWMPGETLAEVLDRFGARYSHIWLCGMHHLSSHAGAIRSCKDRYGTFIICDMGVIDAGSSAVHGSADALAPNEQTIRVMPFTEACGDGIVDLFLAGDGSVAMLNHGGASAGLPNHSWQKHAAGPPLNEPAPHVRQDGAGMRGNPTLMRHQLIAVLDYAGIPVVEP